MEGLAGFERRRFVSPLFLEQKRSCNQASRGESKAYRARESDDGKIKESDGGKIEKATASYAGSPEIMRERQSLDIAFQ